MFPLVRQGRTQQETLGRFNAARPLIARFTSVITDDHLHVGLLWSGAR